MACLYEPVPPGDFKRRDAFPHRVDLRKGRSRERLLLMKGWLSSEDALGNYILYHVKGCHETRGQYEATVLAFDHARTAFWFSERFRDDCW